MRQRIAQKPPPGVGVSPFPRSIVAEGEILYRSTTPAKGPAYFSSSGSGRFDLPHPDGTLYAARSVHTAAMERIAAPVEVTTADGRVRRIDGPYMDGGIEEEDAEQILIWELAPERRLEVANLTDQGAAVFGVTMELSGGGPNAYEVAQEWSAAFRSERVDGVEYSSRFTSSTSAGDNAVAVFGPSGAGAGPFLIAEKPRTLVQLAGVAGINVRIAKRSTPPAASGSL